jgi:hypothetical protein
MSVCSTKATSAKLQADRENAHQLKIQKKYGKPQTPCQRTMASEFISKQVKQQLKPAPLILDPFIREAEIVRKLKCIL